MRSETSKTPSESTMVTSISARVQLGPTEGVMVRVRGSSRLE